MAKKQSPYSPNMGLIAGEAQVAASEAGLTNVGQSFVTGAASVFGAIKQANAERDARMEVYESEIGGLVNTNQFEDPKNKQVIKGFLNTQRDEYIKLSKIYDKTKDREVKDKMEEIKFSLVNLNDQIKVFNQDKIDYRTASDENQLASLKTYDRTGDDFFTSAFTNDAAFSIDEMGDINFGINNNSYKYKDKAGKWESKNNIDESNLLKIYGDSYKEGGKGNAFNSGNVRRGLYNSFKNTGNSALQVFVTTDLTSDESSLSFEEQFASGELSKEMYAGFTAKKNGTYDTDWMFENKNGDLLRNKVSDYFTKVVEDGHGQGRTDNYKGDGTGANVMVNNRLMSSKDFKANYGENSNFALFLGGEGEVLTTPVGFNYERRDGVIYQRTETGFDKKATEDDMRVNEGLPGLSKSKTNTLQNVDLREEESEAKKQFPRPERSIITDPFGSVSYKKVVNKLKELYKDYPGFTFDRAADKQLRILAPDGVTEVFVDMDKSKVTFNAGDSQDKIRDFIYENSKEKANTEFNSTTP